MTFFEDFMAFEFSVPGGVLGETELQCPYCKELLNVTVDEPFGEESYRCGECHGIFEVDWTKNLIRYDASE